MLNFTCIRYYGTCVTPTSEVTKFQHNIAAGLQPWTSSKMVTFSRGRSRWDRCFTRWSGRWDNGTRSSSQCEDLGGMVVGRWDDNEAGTPLFFQKVPMTEGVGMVILESSGTKNCKEFLILSPEKEQCVEKNIITNRLVVLFEPGLP